MTPPTIPASVRAMNVQAKQVIRNFSAGPAILPPIVFERAAEAVREPTGTATPRRRPGSA